MNPPINKLMVNQKVKLDRIYHCLSYHSKLQLLLLLLHSSKHTAAGWLVGRIEGTDVI